jgi:aerobic-type carbon monoxide dehydrogenase small subunit (CoxS/CutS family)
VDKGAKTMKVHIIINGRQREFDILPSKLLLNLLRDDLGLTGAKYGCGIGECGACTVTVDSVPVLGCMTLAVDCDGRSVETIENLSNRKKLHPIQQAYLDEGAVQCGFCTPGFIITTKALLEENPNPNEAEIRNYLKGNLCRCTGYVNIVKAVQKAVQDMR